ncbi:MAG: DNA-binding GntR family transcriptional regulator [Lentisphaeria bacterium]|jgi:DNA-binding GntR family transcriptional regulator
MNSKEDTTLTAHITKTLREGIVTGDLAHGTKLSEPKLAEQFKTSRGPVREAIRRLEMMGLVKHIAHEGVRVITLSPQQVVEIYHVREALEGKAAALAARNISHAELDELNRVMDVHRNHHTSTGAYIQAEGDYDFHCKIIQGSKNPFLIHQLCEDLYHLIRMFRCQSARFQHRSNLALIEHQQLLYALEQRDEQLAELMMRRHIVRAREDIAKNLGEAN